MYADWGRQPLRGLVHVGEESCPGVNPGLAGADRGQTQTSSQPVWELLLLFRGRTTARTERGAGDSKSLNGESIIKNTHTLGCFG